MYYWVILKYLFIPISLQANSISTSPAARSPALIPQDSHSRQDANSVTEVPAPKEGLFKASVIALSSTDYNCQAAELWVTKEPWSCDLQKYLEEAKVKKETFFLSG